MIKSSTSCRWCGVPLLWSSKFEFINYCLKYFSRELEYLSRVFYKVKKGSSKKRVCRNCYYKDISNVHRREITAKCPFIGYRGIDTTPIIACFMLNMYNQKWFHKRYIEYMWLKNHSFSSFVEVLIVRTLLNGGTEDYVLNNEYIEYYYEDMVRSHWQIPNHHEAVWDDHNIINFQLNR